MNNVEKGNKLEDKLYDYLCNQKTNGNLIYGLYTPELCEIYKKKKYYCDMREANIEFDVVIELRRKEAKTPHLKIIFECKNYSNNVPESVVTDFSSKLKRIAAHGAKGVLVVSSPLQQGAQNFAKKHEIGIEKYNEHGFDIVLERASPSWTEVKFIEDQIFNKNNYNKPLKFSAYYDGKFLSTAGELLQWLDGGLSEKEANKINEPLIPFLPHKKIELKSRRLLNDMNYTGGAVDLEKACLLLSIGLNFSPEKYVDEKGHAILGFADFETNNICIYSDENKHRERFTIGHEIGHFLLNHSKFLRSESIIEKDLLLSDTDQNSFNYKQLEWQANFFASCFLLPKDHFIKKTHEFRELLGIQNRGFGEIYVDDQRCNLKDYSELMLRLSGYFKVSKQAIEIKLKKMKLLTDERSRAALFFQAK